MGDRAVVVLPQPVIEQTRGMIEPAGDLGTCVEAVHPWSAVAVCDGAVVWQAGPLLQTPWRSASKPMQLAVSWELLGDLPLTPEELAIGAASHSGEPEHVRWVQGLLTRLGLDEKDLRCGTHAPSHGSSAAAILRAQGSYSAVHNNCSGKHTFMLAAAARQGWDLDYRAPQHPLQQAIRARIDAWTGHKTSVALDGCGVPTFCLPLDGLARAWARLAEAMDDPLDTTRLGAIGRAMRDFPYLVSGTDRLDAAVMAAATEPMAVKVGAGGVFCIALPARRMGLAVKVHSGSMEALPVAVAETLRLAAPGAWQQPESWRPTLVRNVVGALAGHYRPAAS
jgi:L-asparaginase II